MSDSGGRVADGNAYVSVSWKFCWPAARTLEVKAKLRALWKRHIKAFVF